MERRPDGGQNGTNDPAPDRPIRGLLPSMDQRVPGRRWYSSTPVHRPRVLVENSHPALGVSDFSVFTDAGFDVAYCSGPGEGPGSCPLLRGEGCDLLDGADVVLHGLDQSLGLPAIIHERHPETGVVVERRRRADGGSDPVPEGCTALMFPCSVTAQLDAVRRALVRRRTATP